MLTPKLLRIAALGFAVFVAFATLSPLRLRPELTEAEPGFVVLIEHVGAFGSLGLVLSLGYARHPRLVCLVVFVIAVALELLQFFVPDRDPRMSDALAKLAGGGLGIIVGIWLLPILHNHFTWDQDPNPPADHDSIELLLGLAAILLFAVGTVLFRSF